MKLNSNSRGKMALLLMFVWSLLVSVVSAGRATRANTNTVTRVRNAAAAMNKPRLNRNERKKEALEARQNYINMRKQGIDEVSNTEQAAELRNYRLRQKKQKGLPFRKHEASLADVLFPGVSPEEYMDKEEMFIISDLVESKKTQVPFEFYDLPMCKAPQMDKKRLKRVARKNLGARLQGHDLKPAPFVLHVKQDQTCTPLCEITLADKKLKWIKKLIQRQYRVQLSLDQLPVLMRSKERNYAVRGYPIGFVKATTDASDKKKKKFQKNKKEQEVFLYNHLKFTITYREDPPEFAGVRITGFDVYPVSIAHSNSEACQDATSGTYNDPRTYLSLGMMGKKDKKSDKSKDDNTGPVKVVYSYEVNWVQSDLPWSDRWDVYLIGAPDDDIHYFAIVNSLMIVLFLTGAIATIMVRTLRKDIAGYNEMATLEEAQDETGWKLVHGDVFRPPQHSPMLLCVAVGTGAQLGTAFFSTMLCAILGLLNPMKKGQTLTTILVLYVLSGSVAGYVSARLYKYTDDAKAWKRNTILTATALPGVLVSMFMVLNVFLTFVGAATAVSFLTILALFSLWVCVSTPLVVVGSFFGLRRNKIDVPTKTNQIARVVPPSPPHLNPILTMLCGGILPFGSVCIELAFIMSALWLHQIYYVFGFLLVVLFILTATCAQVSIVMTYLQLCAEDHRWWWKSFFNCASAGFYVFLYSLWFLASRLDLVGILPVVVYLTYMSMISISFGLFCGSIGVLSSFWFTKKIYGAVKVD